MSIQPIHGAATALETYLAELAVELEQRGVAADLHNHALRAVRAHVSATRLPPTQTLGTPSEYAHQFGRRPRRSWRPLRAA